MGCVVIPNGWWRTQGAPVNVLSEVEKPIWDTDQHFITIG